MTKKVRKPKLPRRTMLWGIGVLAWLGILFGAALPAWRTAVAQHREVQALEVQLAGLDRWTVAGLWLEKSLEPRRAAINPQWERLFPPLAAKGELFQDLARVADTSGVDRFELKELVPPEGTVVSRGAADNTVPLTTYRVKARFLGRYDQVAEFLGGLKVVDRAVSVHNLAITLASGAVQVDLELDVYVSESDES